MNDIYWKLIVKKLTDSLSKEEESDLQLWLSESKDNKKLFRQAEKLLELSESSLKDFEPETDAEWLKLKSKIEKESETKVIPIRRNNFKWWYAAAGIALILSVGLLMKSPSDTIQQKWITITASSSIEEIILSDSSHIWLNANSSITYPEHFTEDKRLVKLTGEGYFKITPNKQQPFIVQVENSEIKVVGTSFNIKSDDDDIEVSVDEGKVEFTGNMDDLDSKMELEAGKKGNYNRKTEEATIENHHSIPKWLKQVENNLDEVLKEVDKGVNKLIKKIK